MSGADSNLRFKRSMASTRDLTETTSNVGTNIRMSRRRSSLGKTVIPRVSTGNVQALKVKFLEEVSSDENKEKNNNVMPIDLFSSLITIDAVKRDLASRDDILENVSYPDLRSASATKNPARFTGELWQEASSRYTDTELKLTHLPLNVALSKYASFGNNSTFTDDDAWPWPWLSLKVKSSKYITKSEVSTTTFSCQEKLLPFPQLPLQKVLNSYFDTLRLFLRPPQSGKIEKYLDELAVQRKDFYGDQLVNMQLEPEDTHSYRPSVAFQVQNKNLCLTRLEAPLTNTAILTPFAWDLWPEHQDSQIERATILIGLVAEFIKLVYSGRLSVFHDENGYPLCNHQFRKLFASAKIPGAPSDANAYFFKTIFEPDHNMCPTHIVVISRGQMFSVEIFSEPSKMVPSFIIRQNLVKILELAEKINMDSKSGGVGVLTAMDRDRWSEIRIHLMNLSANNSAVLQQLEQALFILTLDEANVRGPERLNAETIFADGCSRWYDKGLSFYVFCNGLITANVCSSLVDGSIAGALLEYIQLRIFEDTAKWDDEVLGKSTLVSRCVSNERMHELTAALSAISNDAIMEFGDLETGTDLYTLEESKYPSYLIFDVDEYIDKAIEDAKTAFKKIEVSFSSAVCQFSKFESGFFATRKIPVDAFAHLALQYNFFKMYYRPAAVGSKISIKRFYHGRYDTMPTSTEESIAFCKAMLNTDTHQKDKLDLFWAAVERHCVLLMEVQSGEGCYNHIAAFREMLKNTENVTHTNSLDEIAELSAGSPETMDISCEGLWPEDSLSVPVVNPPTVTGYGVGYAVADTKALFTVSTWRHNAGTCAQLFARCLHWSLEDLRILLLSITSSSESECKT